MGVRDGYQVLLNIYEPTSTSTSSSSSTPASTTSMDATNDRPCVINFHGGGFSIGSSTDDSRFAHWCTRTSVSTSEASTGETTSSGTSPNPNPGLGAIFISVEYRLSPEYPYPTPVNDCIDATQYILSHPREFGIDTTKVFLSGFSAGGSLAVTTALALSPSSSSSYSSRLYTSFNPMKTISDTATKMNPESRTSTNTNTDLGSNPPTKHPILGVIPFYPVLDFFTPRSQKLINSPEAKPLPGWMTRMFDTSYLPPSPTLHRRDPMISPGLCPGEILVGFPNIHLCLCGGDVLAHEGRIFGERLQRLDERERALDHELERVPDVDDGEGRGEGAELGVAGMERDHGSEVIIREVPEVRHGWDKPPLPLQASVGVEYDAAIESMRRWCNE